MMETLATMRDVGAAATPWAVVIVLCVTLVKVWPALRKIKLDGDTSLRGDLMAMNAALEAKVEGLVKQVDREREECSDRIEALHAKYEKGMAGLEAQIQILRHERNNETMSFDALLLMLETSPEKVAEIIPKIKEQRAQRAQLIAAEKAAIPILKAKEGI